VGTDDRKGGDLSLKPEWEERPVVAYGAWSREHGGFEDRPATGVGPDELRAEGATGGRAWGVEHGAWRI
jgi:hypothetical protein